MGGFNTSVMPPSPAALDLRPPQSTDPLATLAQMGQLQAQRQEIQQRAALAPVQLGTAQLQQQQLQMDIEQRKNMNTAFQQAYEPNANGGLTLNPDKVMQSLATSGSGAAIPEVGQHLAALQKSYADLADTKLKIAGLEADAAGRIGAIVSSAGNDPAMFHALITDAVKQGHLEPGHALALDQAVTQTYQQDPSGAAARALVGQISNQFKAGSPQQQNLAKTAAESREQTARAAHQETVNKLINQGNQAAQNGQNPIDAIFPTSLDQQTHDSYASAWQAAGAQPPDENGRRPAQDAILSAAASHAAEYRKAVSPTIRAGEAATAAAKATAEMPAKVATEEATAPIKTRVAVATQRALNSTAAVGNVPPHLIPQYQGEVAKVANAYGDAANAANEMQEMIDLMRGGNKIAYAYSPTTGVLTINSANGTKRVNTTEIAQYAGAGSLLDKVTGFFGKQLTGASVPSDIVDAMEQVHGTLGEGSRNSAVAKIKSLNAQYGATTDPDAILVRPNKATGGTRGAGLPKVATPADVAKLPKGTHFLDPNGIERIRP